MNVKEGQISGESPADKSDANVTASMNDPGPTHRFEAQPSILVLQQPVMSGHSLVTDLTQSRRTSLQISLMNQYLGAQMLQDVCTKRRTIPLLLPRNLAEINQTW